jgi:hypothetical protein
MGRVFLDIRERCGNVLVNLPKASLCEDRHDAGVLAEHVVEEMVVDLDLESLFVHVDQVLFVFLLLVLLHEVFFLLVKVDCILFFQFSPS